MLRLSDRDCRVMEIDLQKLVDHSSEFRPVSRVKIFVMVGLAGALPSSAWIYQANDRTSGGVKAD